MRSWTELSLLELAGVLGAIPNQTSSSWEISPQKVSTDSRSLQAHDLFFALRGPSFNGNLFAKHALDSQAAGVVVDDWECFSRLKEKGEGRPALWVPDTLKALGKLARYHRYTCPATVIGITGSNGKTTTKDLLYQLLSQKFQGSASLKSFNNFVGVPLTLLRLTPHDHFALVEMGTNHPGEIEYLRTIAQPDFAVITSIGPAHIEAFHSVDSIAQEKFALTHGAQKFFYSNEDSYCKKYLSLLENSSTQLCPVGFQGQESAQNLQNSPYLSFDLNSKTRIETRLLGEHNVTNLLLAIAVAKTLGLSDAECAHALFHFTAPSMRLETHEKEGITLINDAYNANPSSMKAAIETLASYPTQGRKILVAGEMGELGEYSHSSHKSIGELCIQHGLDQILTFGEKAKAFHVPPQERFLHFQHHHELLCFLQKELSSGDTLLFKGSRSNQLEKVVQPLLQESRS